MTSVFLTCCGLLTFVKGPPELHRLATLLHLLLNLPQLRPDLRRKKTVTFIQPQRVNGSVMRSKLLTDGIFKKIDCNIPIYYLYLACFHLSCISKNYLLSEGSVSSRHWQAGWSDGQEVQRRTGFVSAVCERVMPHQSTGTTQYDALMRQQ